MAYRDIAVQLTSYPEPTGMAALEQAVGFAQAFGARLTALTCEIEIPLPRSSYPLSGYDLFSVFETEQEKSKKNAHELMVTLRALALSRGVTVEERLERGPSAQISSVLRAFSQVRDLTMIPLPRTSSTRQRAIAERLIFESGRPLVLLPDHSGIRRPFAPDEVVIAWDRSSPAARAVAESLPILQRAKHVYVVSFVDEKKLPTERAGAEISKHLARHGVETMLEMISTNGKSIGAALSSYLEARHADLLVMGAYGHSRLSEIILGGATKSMLSEPVIPTLISH